MASIESEGIIERLGLERLDHEGGWFKRIHTGATADAGRPSSTTIYALFTREDFSALHRLDAVEQFFFLDGDAFEVFRLGENGVGETQVLGRELHKGQSPHLVFQPGCWFGGKPILGGSHGWTLMSCVVTPGFDWKGFEIGSRGALIAAYPEFEARILELTRASVS
ncbi:cupin domain-containing protein [Pelagicoccus sp. SDUM812003]|uniref:cupin domain-containing protein n=1 Tax=Pelagicoccus sp. SDUM812003 TaxID=3041267 RepID=UPI00280FDCDC|nr:cupin domain-containing protein [Pelagicoccus sp. SDUM812003]MDQ8205562.1 cupin domain-containing protein [Pelagicoccus sp. SDUM812003]